MWVYMFIAIMKWTSRTLVCWWVTTKHYTTNQPFPRIISPFIMINVITHMCIIYFKRYLTLIKNNSSITKIVILWLLMNIECQNPKIQTYFNTNLMCYYTQLTDWLPSHPPFKVISLFYITWFNWANAYIVRKRYKKNIDEGIKTLEYHISPENSQIVYERLQLQI
jgi:hypothetical protein